MLYRQKRKNSIFLLKNTFYNPKLSGESLSSKCLCIMGKITFFGYLRFFVCFLWRNYQSHLLSELSRGTQIHPKKKIKHLPLTELNYCLKYEISVFRIVILKQLFNSLLVKFSLFWTISALQFKLKFEAFLNVPQFFKSLDYIKCKCRSKSSCKKQ